MTSSGSRLPRAAPEDALRPRLEEAADVLRGRGLQVRLDRCLGEEGVVSAPAPERAAELQDMLLDPAVRAVVPPWGAGPVRARGRLLGGCVETTSILAGTAYGDVPGSTQRDAVRSAPAGLDVPVATDVDCGHPPPQLALVEGALAEVVVDPAAGERRLVQTPA